MMRLLRFHAEHERQPGDTYMGRQLGTTEVTTLTVEVDAIRAHGETLANLVEATVNDYIQNVNDLARQA